MHLWDSTHLQSCLCVCACYSALVFGWMFFVYVHVWLNICCYICIWLICLYVDDDFCVLWCISACIFMSVCICVYVSMPGWMHVCAMCVCVNLCTYSCMFLLLHRMKTLMSSWGARDVTVSYRTVKGTVM